MIYDFYAALQLARRPQEKSKEEIDELTVGSGRYSEVKDILSRVLLLNTAYAVKGESPDKKRKHNKKREHNKIEPYEYAKVGERDHPSGLKALMHSSKKYNYYLKKKLSELTHLGMNHPVDLSYLPKGSWVLEFPIILTKPFMSKDDIPFYIIENPVRKDRVFGVPFVSSMTWKGNLRWTMMKIFLEPIADRPDKFAQVRFQHTLLFGAERGWGESEGWTKYVDNLCPDAKELYENMIKNMFNEENAKEVHTQGMLYFHPTFLDKIDMIVINPHDRKTKTGRHPIYFEVVPANARGVFRLLYVPFYWFGLPEKELKKKVIRDLNDVIAGIKEMMLIYGISAKKSSGFGVIEDGWEKEEGRLKLKEFSDVQTFDNFGQLEKIVEKLGDECERS